MPYSVLTKLILACVFLTAGYICRGQLSADFSASKYEGCAPLQVSFTNTTTGTGVNATYSWDLGNSNTSTLSNPGAIYTAEGVYTVTLSVTNEGKTSTQTKKITVYKKPVVDFTMAEKRGCLPWNATFTSTSTTNGGALYSYAWDFGDGNTSINYSANASHTYTLEQKATVSLTVVDVNGCSNTIVKKDIVEVLPPIRSDFTTDKKILCKTSDPVQLTSNCSGPGTLSYVWNFGDGQKSTEKNPSYVFNKKGIYTVSLTVNSSLGCTATATLSDYLNVASYKSDFDDPPAAVCEGSLVSLYNKSTPYPSNNQWFVDDQQVSWYSSTLYHNFYTAGTYTIKLKSMFDNCVDSLEKKIKVNPTPKLDGFIAELQGECGAPVQMNFKDTTAGATQWKWTFNWTHNNDKTDATTQAPSYNYTTNGNRYVRLIVSNAYGCSATTSKYIYIYPPNVDIAIKKSTGTTTRSNCGPFDVTFYVSVQQQEIASYQWFFGDGSTSTEVEPTHHYSKPGSYPVSLRYTTKNGCFGIATLNGNVNLYEQPKINDFSVDNTNVCGNSNVIFNTNISGSVHKLLWDYGDSWGYNDYGSAHSYSREGTYTVGLIALNDACSDTLVKNDYIKVLPPFPKIYGYTTSCKGNHGEITLTHASVNAETVTWDFGDGSAKVTVPASQLSVSHTYTKTQAYNVILTATAGSCNLNTSYKVNVHVKQNMQLALDKTTMCSEGETITGAVSNYEYPPGSSPYYYYNQQFQYSDGTSFYGNSYPTHNYSTNNTKWNLSGFDASKNGLRVIIRSEINGCYDTSNVVAISIKKGVEADFEILGDKKCYYDNPVVTFKDKSVTSTGKIKSWEWHSGDGQMKTSTTRGDITFTYKDPGIYYASLKTTDDQNCTNSSRYASKVVQVNGPKAAFSPYPGNEVYLNTSVNFYNYTNTTGCGYNTQYNWDFGVNNATSVSQGSPSYIYTQPGSYTVKLAVSDPDTKCSSTYSTVIKVKEFNSAFAFSRSFISGSGCPPVLVRFSNTSMNYTRVAWDFGDGFTADNVNYPSHIYEKPGKYYVKLTVHGYNGDISTYIDSVIIKEAAATVKADVSEICKNQPVKMDITATNATSYIWDFGDGRLVNESNISQSHAYNNAGKYSVGIILKDENGCMSSAALSQKINVHPDPAIDIKPLNPLVCRGKHITLNAISNAVSYSWLPDDGSLDDITKASPSASPLSTTTYKVLVKDDIGCSNQKEVTVQVAQPITVKTGNDTAVCIGKPLQLTASGATTYKWINNTEGLNNTDVSNPSLIVSKSGIYTVKGFDAYNCFTSEDNVNVQALSLPTVNAGPDVKALSGTTVQLNAQTSADVVKWEWTPEKYLSCTNCPSPVSTPFSEMTYKITVSNKDNCEASDEVVIKLECEAARVRIPNVFTPNNDGNNDVFSVKGIGIIKHLVIFDRWGTKVFERNNFIAADRSNCWDGTKNGALLPSGTYVYFLEMQCESGEPFSMKGTVVLVR